ncbi:MAG: hypothetical protein AAF847_14470 [Bacteroidota bacterium]
MLPSILKRSLNKRFLQKQIKPIKRPATNLKAAKWIGILFDASTATTVQTILAYKKKLEKQGKKVDLLAFVNNRTKDLSLDFPFFNNRSINWRGVPKNEAIEEFLTRNYDLVFTLCPKVNLSFEYISTLADARVKVGPLTKDHSSYDLMIETPLDTTIANFIQHVESYLPIIKVPAPKVVVAKSNQLAAVG